MADISQITLPSGNTYDIKDTVARAAIASGITFIVSWDGTGEPTPANIPAGVVVTYNSTTYTGTLATTSATVGAFYLVKSSTTPTEETLDIYDEYTVIKPDSDDTTTWFWEKIGDTKLNLSDVVTDVTFTKATDVVLGESTTFTNASSAVSFSGGTTDNALGEATTFTTTVTPSTATIKATATGTAVDADGTATAVTGYSSPTTETFVKSVSAETGKNLVTTSVTGVASNTDVTIPNVTGNSSVTIPNVTDVGTADTWSFTVSNETLTIGGTNGTAPTLGTDLTATNTTLGTALSASKVTTNSTTVATGSTSTTGTGDAVVTGVTVGSSGSAITALGTASTATVLTGVKVTTQPTIALATGGSGTGTVTVATGISSATTSANSDDPVAAVTNIGTGTAAAQTITVGTNDKVTALTNDTTLTVTKGA